MGWSGRSRAPKAPDYTPLAEAQREAARIQKQAADEALEEWQRQYDQTREDYAPWRESGTWAINQLRAGIESGRWDPEEWKGFGRDDFEKSPGYEFRLQEAEKSGRRMAAASGRGADSGATLKALHRYAQDYASNEFHTPGNGPLMTTRSATM